MYLSANMIIFYELSVSAYEILPIWGIYWYYYSTTFKHTKDKVNRYGDHNITTIDEDEYYEGTLSFIYLLLFIYHQLFSYLHILFSFLKLCYLLLFILTRYNLQ